jgi:hypothetical protein
MKISEHNLQGPYVGNPDHTYRRLESDHVNYVRFRLSVSGSKCDRKGLLTY